MVGVMVMVGYCFKEGEKGVYFLVILVIFVFLGFVVVISFFGEVNIKWIENS